MVFDQLLPHYSFDCSEFFYKTPQYTNAEYNDLQGTLEQNMQKFCNSLLASQNAFLRHTYA